MQTVTFLAKLYNINSNIVLSKLSWYYANLISLSWQLEKNLSISGTYSSIATWHLLRKFFISGRNYYFVNVYLVRKVHSSLKPFWRKVTMFLIVFMLLYLTQLSESPFYQERNIPFCVLRCFVTLHAWNNCLKYY